MPKRLTQCEMLALAGFAPLFTQLASAQLADAPDLVMFDAKVHPVGPNQPRAEAFAIKNGLFVAVGSSGDIRNLLKTGVPKDAATVPGFIDTCDHAPSATLLYEMLLGNPFELEFVTIDRTRSTRLTFSKSLSNFIKAACWLSCLFATTIITARFTPAHTTPSAPPLARAASSCPK